MAFGDDLDVHPLCALHPCVLNPTLSSICYESKISAFSESVLVDVASPHMQRAAHNHFTHFHFVPIFLYSSRQVQLLVLTAS